MHPKNSHGLGGHECLLLCSESKDAHGKSEVTLAVPQQAGYSSVGRASDCRHLETSDGPWLDSGWPDFLSVVDMTAVMSVANASK